MSAVDCPRRFTLLPDGGVRATYACGDQVTDEDEIAVDVEILADRFPRAHHHRRHLKRRRP